MNNSLFIEPKVVKSKSDKPNVKILDATFFLPDSGLDAEEEYKKKEEEQNRIGQHHRELNPFWKDGGTGLPPTEEELQKKKEEERRAERRRLQAQLQNEPSKNTFSGKY